MELLKGQSMWVVKIGGSLLGTPELVHWLALITKFSDGNIIVVPGGGIFADAVREAQKTSQINDVCAHELGMLAMDQFGLLMASLNPKLAIARTEMEIDERTWQHRGIVWLPSQMVLADDTIPQNWDVTSDSIAAWLAQKLGASHLVLLKSIKPHEASTNIVALTELGMVDNAFKTFVQGQPFKRWLLAKADYTHFLEGVSAAKLAEIGCEVRDD